MSAPAFHCFACRDVATAEAHNYHPDSDVGPWDAACQCGHICGTQHPVDGGCSRCVGPFRVDIPNCPKCGGECTAVLGERPDGRREAWCSMAHWWPVTVLPHDSVPHAR